MEITEYFIFLKKYPNVELRCSVVLNSEEFKDLTTEKKKHCLLF